MKRENLSNYIELEAGYAKMNHLVEDGRWKVVRYKGYLSIVPDYVNIKLMECREIVVHDGITEDSVFLEWMRQRMGGARGIQLFAAIPPGNDDDEGIYPNYISATTIVGDDCN